MYVDGFCSLIDFGTPEFDEALALRYQVLRKPLGLSFNEEEIASEYLSYHLGYFDPSDGSLLATLTLLPLEDKIIKMRQVAVSSDHQSKGIGSQLVKASEVLVKRLGFHQMVLHARDTAVPFYKSLGYTVVDAPFMEVGIPHAKMIKNIG